MPWHALITRPQRELEACRMVTRHGFRVFYPQHFVAVSHARRREIVLRPLFPGYLFAHADPELQNIFATKTLPPVFDVVRDRRAPLAIPDNVMASLMARADPDGLVHTGRLTNTVAAEGYRLGEFRRLKRNGVLHDLVVQIAAFDSDRQVRVWVALFGGTREATVSAGELGEQVTPEEVSPVVYKRAKISRK